MSRRSQARRRAVLPDPKYGSDMLAKFVNMVMRSGKKSVAERIVYGALDRISERTSQDDSHALELLSQALENVKPAVEVKSRRVGGATYQVPIASDSAQAAAAGRTTSASSARDALGDRCGTGPLRENDGTSSRSRAHGRCRESGRRRQEA